MATLLLAEQKDGHLNDVTARALTAAKELGELLRAVRIDRV